MQMYMMYMEKIYRNPSEGNPLSGIPLLDNPQIGYITYAGYNTIKLNNPLRLYPGDSFSVVLKLHNSEGENARIFIDCEEDIYDDDLVISTLKNHVEEGQSFLVFDDGSFKDFATYYNNNQCARINEYYHAWEHPFSRLRAYYFSSDFSCLGAHNKHYI